MDKRLPNGYFDPEWFNSLSYEEVSSFIYDVLSNNAQLIGHRDRTSNDYIIKLYENTTNAQRIKIQQVITNIIAEIMYTNGWEWTSNQLNNIFLLVGKLKYCVDEYFPKHGKKDTDEGLYSIYNHIINGITAKRFMGYQVNEYNYDIHFRMLQTLLEFAKDFSVELIDINFWVEQAEIYEGRYLGIAIRGMLDYSKEEIINTLKNMKHSVTLDVRSSIRNIIAVIKKENETNNKVIYDLEGFLINENR